MAGIALIQGNSMGQADVKVSIFDFCNSKSLFLCKNVTQETFPNIFFLYKLTLCWVKMPDSKKLGSKDFSFQKESLDLNT
jgi:hypothetical protein